MAQLGIVAIALTTLAATEAPSRAQRQASIFGLVAETASFSDFRDALGPAEVRHNGGDAAASAYFTCYVGPDGTALVLESNSGLRLGMTRAEVVRAVGRHPSGSAHSAVFFIIEDRERPVPDRDGGVIGNPSAWLSRAGPGHRHSRDVFQRDLSRLSFRLAAGHTQVGGKACGAPAPKRHCPLTV